MDPDIKEDNDSTDHIERGFYQMEKDNELFGSSVLLVGGGSYGTGGNVELIQ